MLRAQFRGPEWELLVHTPAVFVRAANTGVAGNGTWKRVRKRGSKDVRREGKRRKGINGSGAEMTNR